MKRSIAVAIAVALALLVALVVVFAVRDGTAESGSCAPEWERISARGAGFSPVTNAYAAGTVDGKLLALGRENPWTSDDAREWRAHTLPSTPRAIELLEGPVRFRNRWIIWSFHDGPGVAMWSTPDGEHWARVPIEGLEDADGVELAVHGGRLVATAGIDSGGGAWSSSDAVHWTPARAPDVGSVPTLSNPVWVDGRFIALSPTDIPQRLSAVWASHDGTEWMKVADTTPPRLASLVVPAGQGRVYGIQYETALSSLDQGGTFGGRVWSSADGVTWSEVHAFHDRFPVANPDHIIRAHGWWIVSGNTGTPDGRRRDDIWWSRDLRHWSELPRRLQGRAGSGTGVPTASNAAAVVAKSTVNTPNKLWIWNP